MQANSQLYEAVRQKVDLGQQLEQWQVCSKEEKSLTLKSISWQFQAKMEKQNTVAIASILCNKSMIMLIHKIQ